MKLLLQNFLKNYILLILICLIFSILSPFGKSLSIVILFLVIIFLNPNLLRFLLIHHF